MSILQEKTLSTFRPEISHKVLTPDRWRASIQPQSFQNYAGEYPWIPVDKTRLEVPQTNLLVREELDRAVPHEYFANPPINLVSLQFESMQCKQKLVRYDRFDPSLGNCLDTGSIDSNLHFLAFPSSGGRTVLSVSPMTTCQLYPEDDEGSQTGNLTSMDDMKIRHALRSTIDTFSPIRQITNIDPTASGQSSAFLSVRTAGGASIVKVMPASENSGAIPFKLSAPAGLAFNDKSCSTNLNAVDMAANPYYRGETIIASDTGYFGIWNYESKPRAFLTDLSTIRPGGTLDDKVSHDWHSCKYASHPRLIYTAYPYQVDLCDLRAKPGSNTSLIYQLRDPTIKTDSYKEENICALAVPPNKHSFEVALATGSNIQVYDTRFTKRSVLNWQHHIRQLPPSHLEWVTDQANGFDTSHILAWHPYSKSAHVFEYGKINSLDDNIVKTMDMSYNRQPLTPHPPSTSKREERTNRGGSYYVAPRQLYALPTCRYRPAHSAWVSPYPQGKIDTLRDNPPLAGLRILPGIARTKSESEDSPSYTRTWTVFQLCRNGSLRSKIWCRRTPENKYLRRLDSFHRPSTEFGDVAKDHTDEIKHEIEKDSRTMNMGPLFRDMTFGADDGDDLTKKEADVEELERLIIESAKSSMAPKVLLEILQEDNVKSIGRITDEVIGNLEKRLSSFEAVHERKVWHYSIAEYGLIDPVSLDLGDRIHDGITKLRNVCYIKPHTSTHSVNGDGDGRQTVYMDAGIKHIARDLTASRHIIGIQPQEIDDDSNSQDQAETRNAMGSNNLLFPHLFNAEQTQSRKRLRLNPAANALAGDWDIASDPSTYNFRRLDGMTMDEVLEIQQKASSRKKKTRQPTVQFTVQDSQSLIPDVVVTNAKQEASNVSLSLPSTDDLEFSTQWLSPSPEKSRTTGPKFTSSQPVPGPYGSRIKATKKKKKRSQGF